MKEIICSDCGQYESQCRCGESPDKVALTDEMRNIARSMITCSHENMLDDEEFDKYLSKIVAKAQLNKTQEAK